MQGTHIDTILIPVIGASNTPGPIAKASNLPIRVLVENTSAALVFLSTDVENLSSTSTGPTTGTYRLPSNVSRVFVLAPKQSLYAITAGAGAYVSVAISEALPIDISP